MYHGRRVEELWGRNSPLISGYPPLFTSQAPTREVLTLRRQAAGGLQERLQGDHLLRGGPTRRSPWSPHPATAPERLQWVDGDMSWGEEKGVDPVAPTMVLVYLRSGRGPPPRSTCLDVFYYRVWLTVTRVREHLGKKPCTAKAGQDDILLVAEELPLHPNAMICRALSADYS